MVDLVEVEKYIDDACVEVDKQLNWLRENTPKSDIVSTKVSITGYPSNLHEYTTTGMFRIVGSVLRLELIHDDFDIVELKYPFNAEDYLNKWKEKVAETERSYIPDVDKRKRYAQYLELRKDFIDELCTSI